MHVTSQRHIDGRLVSLGAVTIAVLAVSVILRYGAAPLWVDVRKDMVEVARYEQLLGEARDYEVLKERMREHHNRLQARVAELTEGMGDPEDLSSLLQMIYDKAWSAGVRITSTKPQSEQRRDDYLHYPVILQFETDFASLGAFVSSVERSPQIMRLERLALDVNRGGTLEVAMKITCFLKEKT